MVRGRQDQMRVGLGHRKEAKLLLTLTVAPSQFIAPASPEFSRQPPRHPTEPFRPT